MNASQFLGKLKVENILRKDLPSTLVNLMIAQDMQISTAESCTGGMLCQKIVSVPSASKVLDFGVCTYADIAKATLKVTEGMISKYTVVSPQVAIQMAKSIQKVTSSDIAISTTGIAGPSGSSKDKPVGLVYIGVAIFDKIYAIKTMCNNKPKTYDRVKVMEMASDMALYYAIKLINSTLNKTSN